MRWRRNERSLEKEFRRRTRALGWLALALVVLGLSSLFAVAVPSLYFDFKGFTVINPDDYRVPWGLNETGFHYLRLDGAYKYSYSIIIFPFVVRDASNSSWFWVIYASTDPESGAVQFNVSGNLITKSWSGGAVLSGWDNREWRKAKVVVPELANVPDSKIKARVKVKTYWGPWRNPFVADKIQGWTRKEHTTATYTFQMENHVIVAIWSHYHYDPVKQNLKINNVVFTDWYPYALHSENGKLVVNNYRDYGAAGVWIWVPYWKPEPSVYSIDIRLFVILIGWAAAGLLVFKAYREMGVAV